MNQKRLIVFLTSFILFYVLIKLVSGIVITNLRAIDKEQVQVIHETITNRFKTYLRNPISIATLAADHFSRIESIDQKFEDSADSILQLNPELLGLNILNEEGVITRVYPKEDNLGAKNKTSQNKEKIMSSFTKGETYWVSPPFKLFQGQEGFAIYVPIIMNHKLKGWAASVVSSQKFFENFGLTVFFKSYELVIKDHETNLTYFKSSDFTPEDDHVQNIPKELLGRTFDFVIWRKNSNIFYFPWFLNFLVSILFAGIFTYGKYVHEQKIKAQSKLKQIRNLLHITSSEALSKLVDIHKEYKDFKDSHETKATLEWDVSYISNLIEQVDLLQTIATPRDQAQEQDISFLEKFEEQLKVYSDVIKKKQLNIEYNRDDLRVVSSKRETNLLQSSTISTILSHCILFSEDNSCLKIENKSDQENYVILFRLDKVHPVGPQSGATQLNRRMELASRILGIYDGKLSLQNDLGSGMIIRVLLPKN